MYTSRQLANQTKLTVDDLADDVLRDAVCVDTGGVADLDLLHQLGVLEGRMLQRHVGASWGRQLICIVMITALLQICSRLSPSFNSSVVLPSPLLYLARYPQLGPFDTRCPYYNRTQGTDSPLVSCTIFVLPKSSSLTSSGNPSQLQNHISVACTTSRGGASSRFGK